MKNTNDNICYLFFDYFFLEWYNNTSEKGFIMIRYTKSMINNRIDNVNKRVKFLLERYELLLQSEKNILSNKDRIKKEIQLISEELLALQEQRKYLTELYNNNDELILYVDSKKVKPIKKYKI